MELFDTTGQFGFSATGWHILVLGNSFLDGEAVWRIYHRGVNGFLLHTFDTSNILDTKWNDQTSCTWSRVTVITTFLSSIV